MMREVKRQWEHTSFVHPGVMHVVSHGACMAVACIPRGRGHLKLNLTSATVFVYGEKYFRRREGGTPYVGTSITY